MSSLKKDGEKKSVRKPAGSKTAGNVTAVGAGGSTGSESVGTSTGELAPSQEIASETKTSKAAAGKFGARVGPSHPDEL
jgi:hypothetical protein